MDEHDTAVTRLASLHLLGSMLQARCDAEQMIETATHRLKILCRDYPEDPEPIFRARLHELVLHTPMDVSAAVWTAQGDTLATLRTRHEAQRASQSISEWRRLPWWRRAWYWLVSL